MTSAYFDEKARQVNPGKLVAFGIKIISRHSKASELIEMLSFAERAALDGVADAVQEIFYDSNAAICSFKFSREISFGDPIERKLFAAAIEILGSFNWVDDEWHCGEGE